MSLNSPEMKNGKYKMSQSEQSEATAVLVNFDVQKKRQDLIKKIEDLPPLPASAQQVLSIVASDPKDISRLEETISHDMNLTSQLLKVANSAAYYPEAKINTVQRAIVYLGFSQVRNIALSLSMSSFLRLKKKNRLFDLEKFWIHSIATAMIARILAFELDMDEPEVYFTAGLLHDIGRAAMNACFQEEFNNAIRYAEEEELSLLAAERHFDMPHNMIGAWLVKNWKLPAIYVRAVATHHLSVKNRNTNKTGVLIGLADQISHNIGMGFMNPPRSNRYQLANYLGMSPDHIDEIEEQLGQIEEIALAIADGFHMD